MRKFLMALFMVGFLVGLAGTATAGALITFSEFPVGTVVSTQYAPQDVVFWVGTEGTYPIIANDGAMPTSPVLSPNPPYAGDFWMQFPTPVSYVSFISGYWDTLGSGIINVWSPTTFIESLTDTSYGVDTFTISGVGPIEWVYFNSANDPAGADIDNLKVGVPEPATMLLLGLGLLGLAGFRKKFRA